MKVRTGFVSNSSSSSFLIYGFCIEKNDLIKKLEGIEDLKEKILTEFEVFFIDDVDDRYELFEYVGDIMGVRYFNICDSDYAYFGRSYDGIKDDETGKQFKDSVEERIKKVLGNDCVCQTLKEAWYN